MKTTARELREYGWEKAIEESGSRYDQPFLGSLWSINTSSILTRLIQEAGRYCEHYASDLFIQWSRVEKMLNDEIEPETQFFGFRENGVDHEAWIDNRLEEYSGSRAYRSIWRLDIWIEESDSYYKSKEIKMKLYRVN